jgi:hypothetical protein
MDSASVGRLPSSLWVKEGPVKDEVDICSLFRNYTKNPALPSSTVHIAKIQKLGSRSAGRDFAELQLLSVAL